MDNDGAESLVAGGFTQSKDLVWSDPQNNFYPPRVVPTNRPTGCYQDTDILCSGAAISDNALKGVAYIFKSKAQITTGVENIIWQKFFENYNSVTAIKLSRNEAITAFPAWDTGTGAYAYEPVPKTIYKSFVAAFLQSRCLTEKPHKIVILDYSTGAVLQAIPFTSKQTVFQQQFLFQYVGSGSTDVYQYAVYTARNASVDGASAEYLLQKFQPVQASSAKQYSFDSMRDLSTQGDGNTNWISDIADNYKKRDATISGYSTLKYGPQSLVQLESYIYMGGAVGFGSRFCPTLAKFDKDLTLKWSYRANSCSDTAIDSNSYAVDMMYADGLNDHIYGLMVPRDYNGNLVSAQGYKLFKTRGNGAETASGFTTGCSQRRINIIHIRPQVGTSFYWRPLSINYYQEFLVGNQAAPFKSTTLLLQFRQTSSSSDLTSNALQNADGFTLFKHQNEITDRMFTCNENTANQNLLIPNFRTHNPQGSATHMMEKYGKTFITATLSDNPQNVFLNAQAQTGYSELLGMSGATIIDETSGKKKVAIKNQNPFDKYSQTDLLGANTAANQIAVVEENSPANNDLTTTLAFTTSGETTLSFDCTSSMMIPGPNGHYGNTQSSSPYDTVLGNLFVNEFWDDRSYEIVPDNVRPTFGNQNEYVTNTEQPEIGLSESCEVSSCVIKKYDRTNRNCITNFTNTEFLSATDPNTADNEEYWLIKMQNPFVNEEYASKDGIIKINQYPPNEFRIWICLACQNDFQSVTTKPFMIDMQCGASSTTITVPATFTSSYAYSSNYRTQTYEATNTQGSIYFEFEEWSSSTGACPIIEYKVTIQAVEYTNQGATTPNTLYGKDSSGNYVYESGTTCSATNCAARQQPTITNNTVTFYNQGGTTAGRYSPDDIAEYGDEDQTSAKRNGGAYAHYTSTTTANENINVFRQDSQVLHVLDCNANHNSVGSCSRLTTDTDKHPERSFNIEERDGKNYYKLYLYETRIIQQIKFTITALAEGGKTHAETDLILNVTCPSFGKVNAPEMSAYGTQIDSAVTRYVGALDTYATYTFPDFYPEQFEYCNFITSYTLADVNTDQNGYNNTIGSMYDFTSIEAPEGMVLTSALTNARLPATRKTIQVDTVVPRTYTYNIMIELKLTKTTWADYLYSFSGVDHQITVKYGSPDTSATPKIQALKAGFPSETGQEMYKILTLGDGTNGKYEYEFDHFQCNQANLALATVVSGRGSGQTCTIYNISSSNTEMLPIKNYNGYSIDPPVTFWSATENKWKLKVTVPTDVLRNSTAGNQIQFYIWSVYNNYPSDAEADARYAAFSEKMVIDVKCGSETVSITKKEYILDYHEGTKKLQNVTFLVDPESMTLEVDNYQCPFVKLELFEDKQLSIPWTNTSYINLINGDDPYNAYLNITTYEEERETWLREVYIKATTLGGKTNIHATTNAQGVTTYTYDSIHIDITIIETFNDREVNHAPQFLQPIPTLVIDVWERDLILKNTSKFHYWSPKAEDNEGDEITIKLIDQQKKPFLNLKTFYNDSFGIDIDRSMLNYLDEGTHTFKVKLSDKVFSSQANSKWKDYKYRIDYKELNPSQFYYFTFKDIEQIQQDYAEVVSITLYCPDITITNSTVVKNLCLDIQSSRTQPEFEYTVEIDNVQQPTKNLKNADYIRFGFNLTSIEQKMNERGYKISPAFVNETFHTSILKVKTQRPTNFTCFKDPKCNDVTEAEYDRPLTWFNNFTLPNLNDTINFITAKLMTLDRPEFIEADPEPDLRPPPELKEIRLFTNSSIKLSFNEPVQFANSDPQVIDYELTHNTLKMKIKSGFDGSVYQAYQYSEKVEKVEEKMDIVVILTEEEKAALAKQKKLEAFNDKISYFSIKTWQRVDNILAQATPDFKDQLINLSEIMTVVELENYINSLSLSALWYKETGKTNSTGGSAAEEDTTDAAATDENAGGRRLNSYYDELLLEHANDLKFGFHYDSGEQTNDLWIKLDFKDFGYVNIGENMDNLQIQVQNTSFIVSVATLKPLSNESLGLEYSLSVPPLEPTDNEYYEDFLTFLIYLQYVIFTLQIIAYIQNVFLDGRSHQSIWSMANTMQLIAHTSLFKINSIPGSLYVIYMYMIRFYSITIRIPSLQVLALKFSEKQAFSRRFYEMGYYTSNFIPLQFTVVCFVIAILFFSIIFNTCARISVRNYKKTCCRWVGIILPGNNFFRRIFFRLYLLIFIQIFLSAIIALFPIESVDSEFQYSKYDGVSVVFAIIVLCINVPILLHMSYVIIFNHQYLEDKDMLASYGHYYVDLNTFYLSQALYHVLYIFRRMWFVILIVFLRDHPDLQLILHICTTSAMLMYIAWVKPFKIWLYNMYDIINEATVFGLAVIEQSFINVSTDPGAKQVFGWIFISIWLVLTLTNLGCMIYSSFVQNYHLWLGVVQMRDRMKMHEKQVQTDVVFKGRFVYDNPSNFMMAFETTNTKQYLEYRIFENHIFNEKYRKAKQIEWLEKNNFNKKQIREIYPDYQPKKFKDMYLVDEPTPPPPIKPIAPHKEEAKPSVQEPSADVIAPSKQPSKVDAKTKKNPKKPTSKKKEDPPKIKKSITPAAPEIKQPSPPKIQKTIIVKAPQPEKPPVPKFQVTMDVEKSVDAVRKITGKKKKKKKKSSVAPGTEVNHLLSDVQEIPGFEESNMESFREQNLEFQQDEQPKIVFDGDDDDDDWEKEFRDENYQK